MFERGSSSATSAEGALRRYLARACRTATRPELMLLALQPPAMFMV